MTIPTNSEMWTESICKENMYACFAALRKMNDSALAAVNSNDYRTAFNKVVDMTAGATSMHNTGLTDLKSFVADNSYLAAQIVLGGLDASDDDRRNLALAGLKDARSNVPPSEGELMTWYIHKLENGKKPEDISREMSPHFPFEVISTLKKNDERLRDAESAYHESVLASQRRGNKIVPVVIVLIVLGLIGAIFGPKVFNKNNKDTKKETAVTTTITEKTEPVETEPPTEEPTEISYDGIVTSIEKVADTEYDYSYTYYCPVINIDSDDAAAANLEMKERFDSIDSFWITTADYVYYINNDMLSVTTYFYYQGGGHTDYYPYTFDLKTGKRLDNADLTDRFDVSSDDVLQSIRNAFMKYFEANHMTPDYFDVEKDDYQSRDDQFGYFYGSGNDAASFYYSTMDENNLNDYHLFVGTKGLMAAVQEYGPGAGRAWVVIDIPGERRFRYFKDLLEEY